MRRDRTTLVLLLRIAVAGAAAGACTMGDAAAPASKVDEGAVAPAVPAGTPTWFRDVEPIVQRECVGCHTLNGTGGFALDRTTTTLLAALVAERVSAGDMPPWPPGPDSSSMAASRALDAGAIATIAAWAAAGAPAGDPADHVERAPRVASVPARPADLHLELGPDAYRQPTNYFVTDEIRCFVLDLPATSAGLWVTAARWRAGTPVGIHDLGGIVLDENAATIARARAGLDGRTGFECGGGLGDLARGPSLGASGSGSPGDGATTLPPGTAVRIPARGAVLMRVHYAVKHLGGIADRSGVDLWVADDVARRTVRPLLPAAVAAPVEVPCPAGVSLDPSQPCSRENAFVRLASADPAGARARADAMLAACGTTLASAASGAATGDHFIVPTSCTTALPFAGTIRVVEARMQTRGATVRIETERSDGTWSTVLDIPRWRWFWAGSYVLAEGVPVEAGKHLRVSCTFDNGSASQWSALTGEPGHDGPARPPVLGPQYIVTAPHRAAEACEALVGIERAPYRGARWASTCDEAQAVVTDACSAGAVDLVSRGCPDTDEDTSVGVLGSTPAALRARFCPGKSP